MYKKLIQILITVIIFIPGISKSQWIDNDPFEFPGISSFSANSNQYFARFNTKPTGDTLKWYAEFIDSLTANGIWVLIDEMWIYANNNSVNALIGVKGYKNCTAVNSPTFAAYRGYTGNGSTSYLNTNYNPAVDKITLNTNSISYGAYSRTDLQSNRSIIGSIGASPNRYMYMYPRTNTDLFFYSANTRTDVSVSNNSSLGLFAGNRSDTSSMQGYRNGVRLASITNNFAADLNNLNVYVLCQNQNGTATDLSTRQISFAFIGASLTQQQHLNLYNCLQRLLTKIGANV